MNCNFFFDDICRKFKKSLSKTLFLCYTVIIKIKYGGNTMSVEYTIPLTKIEQEFNLTRVTVPENYEEIKVETPEVNRPGLALTGFYEIFERSRISIIGNAEHLYLRRLDPEDRKKKITDYVYKVRRQIGTHCNLCIAGTSLGCIQCQRNYGKYHTTHNDAEICHRAVVRIRL